MYLLTKQFTLLILFVFCCFVYRNTVYKNPIYSLSDAEGYYMYLPCWFIYKNYKDIPIRTESEFSRLENGNYYSKYTFGVAIMQAPFFISAHALNSLFGWYPSDGYSKIYQKSIFISAAFYCFFGLLILYNLIRKMADAMIAGLVTASIFLGTNLLFYTLHAPGMSHVYSFFLVTWLISITYYRGLTFLDNSLLKYSLILGMIILVRPLNILILLYPIFLALAKYKDWSKRVLFVKQNFLKGTILILPAVLLLCLNIIEWSKMKGSFHVYSYTNESFIYWNNPKILRVLFDIQNGLFIYAPILFTSLFGMIKFYSSKIEVRSFVWMFVIFTYFFGSWWAWWFGGAYGHRCYVDILALFAIPLGLLLHSIKISGNKILYYGIRIFSYISIFYSLRMTQLYVSPWDGPSWTIEKYLGELAKAFYLN